MSSLYLGSSSPTTSCTSHRILLPFYGSCKYVWKVKLIICEKKNVQFCRRILRQPDVGPRFQDRQSSVGQFGDFMRSFHPWYQRCCFAILHCHILPISLYLAIYCHIVILYISLCCHIVYLASWTQIQTREITILTPPKWSCIVIMCLYNVYVQCTGCPQKNVW